MEKIVYVVIQEYWDGARLEAMSNVCVYENEDDAREFVEEMNSRRKSQFSALYSYNAFELK